MAAIKVNTQDNPWYADYANFIVSKFLPPNFTYQQRKKFFYDLRHYFWDDPHLYKEGVDGIIRRCIPEHEQHYCWDDPRFYWPTLFKDARKFILSCNGCQRVGNISRRNEIL